MKTKTRHDRRWKRILKLADKLDSLPRKRFNFGKWVGEDWRGASDFSCGTSGCAMGWATTMPYFQKLGLRLRKFAMSSISPHYDGTSWSHDSAKFCELFGVSHNTLLYLFIPYSTLLAADKTWPTPAKEFKRMPTDVTPKRWARNARRLVKALEKGRVR